MTHLSRTFAAALLATGPAPEYAEQLSTYGQFVGDWTTRTRTFAPDGTVEESEWDVRFDWVLEGRAIQDVWITPERRGRTIDWHEPGNRYSTTLRFYDPQLDAWHIIWVNPPSGGVMRQLGRKIGDEIVQDTVGETGDARIRWVWRDITPHSFRWCNETSSDCGLTWALTQEMQGRRTHAYV